MSALIPAGQVPISVALVVVSGAVAVVFFAIADRLARRPVSESSRLASYLFALWWIGIGTSVAINAVLVGLALTDTLPFPLGISIYLVSLLVDCVFLAALVSALTYVYTGSYHLLEIGGFYLAFYAVLLDWALSQSPDGLSLHAGVPALAFTAAANPALTAAVTLGLLVPGVAAAVAYLSLLRETADRSIRFRIALVGGSILLWFALEILVPSTTASWVLTRSVLELVPGGLSLLALIPPAGVRRRFGVPAPGGKEEYYRRRPAER